MGKQRMAGDIWNTYDAGSNGGAGFDQSDFDYLRSQNWSNNDIFKAAAKSGSVDGQANQSLNGLSKTLTFKDLPSKAQKKMRGVQGASYTFMGGDANDAKNYRMSKGEDKGGKSIEQYAMDYPSDDRINNWNKNSESRHGSEILQWNGINADGSANALNGYTESYNKKDRNTPFKRTDTTWALPRDVVQSNKQAEYDRFSANSINNKPAATTAPAAPRFNVSDYLSSGQGTSSNGDSSTASFALNLKTPSWDEYMTKRKAESATAPTPYKQLDVSDDRGSSSTSSSQAASTGTRTEDGWKRFWNPDGPDSIGSGDKALGGHFRSMADRFRSRYQNA